MSNCCGRDPKEAKEITIVGSEIISEEKTFKELYVENALGTEEKIIKFVNRLFGVHEDDKKKTED